MKKIEVLKNQAGDYKIRKGKYIFKKEGVYFSLNKKQMNQMSELFKKILKEV